MFFYTVPKTQWHYLFCILHFILFLTFLKHPSLSQIWYTLYLVFSITANPVQVFSECTESSNKVKMGQTRCPTPFFHCSPSNQHECLYIYLLEGKNNLYAWFGSLIKILDHVENCMHVQTNMKRHFFQIPTYCWRLWNGGGRALFIYFSLRAILQLHSLYLFMSFNGRGLISPVFLSFVSIYSPDSPRK